MTVVVFGAGGPAGVNTCRALHQGGHSVIAQDDNPEHLVWCEPWAETTTEYEVDAEVAWVQPDRMVAQLSLRGSRYKTLLPNAGVIALCQDKWKTAVMWSQSGLRNGPLWIGPEIPDWLHVAKDGFGTPFWLRATHGAGGKAATLVDDLRTGYHWIRYWQTRGENISFMAEEYLPGDNYCWTSLWYEGELVASFARRRDEWMYGRIGTPSISTVVHDSRVTIAALDALHAIDKHPHGAYAVDLCEDGQGNPRPTEINAGRWPTTTGLYAELGPNLPDMAVRLAMGEDVDRLGEDIYEDGARLYRHVDCPLAVRFPVAA